MAGLWLLLSQGTGKGPRLKRKETSPPGTESAFRTQNCLHEGRESTQLTAAQVAGSVRPGPGGLRGQSGFLREHFETWK